MQPQNDRGSRCSSGVSLEHPRSWVYSLRKASPMRFSMHSRGRRRVQQNLLDLRAYRSRMQVTSSNSFGSKASYCDARLSRSPEAWSTCTRGSVSDFLDSWFICFTERERKKGICKTWKSIKNSSRTSPLRVARCCAARCTKHSFGFSWGPQPARSGRMFTAPCV